MSVHDDPAHGRTIDDLQQQIGRALDALEGLRAHGQLPPELDALRYLAPRSGSSARVVFHYDDGNGQLGRDMHDHVAQHYWRPEAGYIAKIWYADTPTSVHPPRADVVREVPASPRVVVPSHVRELVRELDKAERGKPYVVLRWFLDTWLVSSRLHWSGEPAIRQRTLNEAIDAGLVLTGKASNPKNPDWPSTTVRLDRSRPEVAELLARADELPEFKPVPVRGEPVSETIIRERR
jgi:hypothetical protein